MSHVYCFLVKKMLSCASNSSPPKKPRLSPTRATAAAEGLQGLRKVSAICGSVKLLDLSRVDGPWICVFLAQLGWFHSAVGILLPIKMGKMIQFDI